MSEGLGTLHTVSDSLFDVPGEHASAEPGADAVFRRDSGAPLAVRMRPANLDEVIGQAHLLGPGSPLRRLVEGSGAASVLLYGPPGTGKTTLASLLSQATGRRFEALSALSAGVKEVRAVIDLARRLYPGDVGERGVGGESRGAEHAQEVLRCCEFGVDGGGRRGVDEACSRHPAKCVTVAPTAISAEREAITSPIAEPSRAAPSSKGGIWRPGPRSQVRGRHHPVRSRHGGRAHPGARGGRCGAGPSVEGLAQGAVVGECEALGDGGGAVASVEQDSRAFVAEQVELVAPGGA